MTINEKHFKILQTIKQGNISEKDINQITGFSVSSIRYYVEELEKLDFLNVARGYQGGSLAILYTKLTNKGEHAIKNPDDFIDQSSKSTVNTNNNHITISGSSNTINTIPILNQSDNNTFNINQNIDQSVTEVIKYIDCLTEAIKTFPEDKQEIASVHLEDLREEYEQPERRNPKKIKAYFTAFLGITLPLLGYVANITYFINNITDLAEKLNLELPQLETIIQGSQITEEQHKMLLNEIDQKGWSTLKQKINL